MRDSLAYDETVSRSNTKRRNQSPPRQQTGEDAFVIIHIHMGVVDWRCPELRRLQRALSSSSARVARVAFSIGSLFQMVCHTAACTQRDD